LKQFKTLDDISKKGKTVLVRIDINTSIDDDGKPQMSERIEAASETIRELSDDGAKVVALAHQGRPGDDDFTELRGHAKLLAECLDRDVGYIDDILGPGARKAVSELQDGDILLLENVRFLAEETLKLSPEGHAKSYMVRKLSPLIDVFVNDAFSAAHRSQASLVGFTVDTPKAMGRTMEREVSSISKAMEDPEKPCVYILGGLKPQEAFEVMNHGLSSGGIDRALTCGIVGRICLLAKGVDTGPEDSKFFEKKGFVDFVPRAEDIIGEFGERVMTPVDVGALKGEERVEIDVSDLPTDLEIFDIGPKTLESYGDAISSAKTVVMNGPAGVYEEDLFRLGTEGLLKAVSESSAFSLMGGGHTLKAMEKLSFTKDEFSYVSLAGGALISFLSGEEMPAIEALKV
jgi:phosphoglycerate kinase